ncbi:hypothetical protein R1sor_017108 [Riccia sorocarpa]|uniref:Cationic amino acid transporter C-terminal domain-containing protein n=1 Tax=Riccia sorocarpa TaxID=122646 RepID=A0ABD3I9V8_9MARC
MGRKVRGHCLGVETWVGAIRDAFTRVVTAAEEGGREEPMEEQRSSRVFRRKSVVPKKVGQQLARHLSWLDLVPIGLGATLGAGVYVLVGTVAREKVGPALPFSFLIAGFAAALSALCYAELASRCPSAGSAYHYAYTCVGELPAWIIGWALILEYTVGGSTVARGISPNLAIFFGGSESLPVWIARRELFGITVDPCAGILVLIVTALLCVGIKESANVQAFMTVANVLVLLFVIGAGGFTGFKTGWKGYHTDGGYLPYGVNGILAGAATLFFAFIGFDTVASTAEEVKNPQRDLPLGIALALIICSALYMFLSSVIVGMVPYNLMDVDTPLSTAFADNGLPWAMYIVTAGAVAALSTTLLGSLLPQPRILMAMARDGLLPRFFARINKATKVPVNGTLVAGFVASLMAFSMNVDQLAGMVSVGTLLAFTIVGVSILILRYVSPMDPVAAPPPTEQLTTSTQPRAAIAVATPTPTPAVAANHTLVGLIAWKNIITPVFSFLSESSVNQLPSFLQNYEDEADANVNGNGDRDVVYDERDGNYPNAYRDSVQEPLMPDSPEGESDSPAPEMSREEARRWAAAFGIGVINVGSMLFSVAVSFPFEKYFKWAVAGFGGFCLLGGLAILGIIDQDEGRHKFGNAGGFQVPWVPVLPTVSILINTYLLVNLGGGTWMRVGVWLVLGLIVYATYGINHSVLAKEHGKDYQRSHSLNEQGDSQTWLRLEAGEPRVLHELIQITAAGVTIERHAQQ